MTVVISGFRHGSGFRSLKHLHFTTGPIAWLFVLLSATVGFRAGIDGSARLLGHAFGTHHEYERSVIATVMVWGVFLMAFEMGLVFLSTA